MKVPIKVERTSLHLRFLKCLLLFFSISSTVLHLALTVLVSRLFEESFQRIQLVGHIVFSSIIVSVYLFGIIETVRENGHQVSIYGLLLLHITLFYFIQMHFEAGNSFNRTMYLIAAAWSALTALVTIQMTVAIGKNEEATCKGEHYLRINSISSAYSV